MSGLAEAILTFFAGEVDARTGDDARKARLLTGFGLLGFVFGSCYALFYLLIGHIWGATVIVLCSLLFALIPWLLRAGRPLPLLGHLFSIILVGGFMGLCFVEGGLHGHAIAWLAAIPLCALLLVGLEGAALWGTICLSAAAVIAAFEFAGIPLPNRCPPEWNDIVSTAGYLGLTLFMLLLGIIFERGRSLAARRTEEALVELSGANQRLQQLNQDKNEFLSIAAHDLKNPLTVVMGMSDLLASGYIPPERIKATAGKISEQSVRMRSLISNLLDLNAIEEGRMQLKAEPLDLGGLVDICLENFGEVAGRKQIELACQNTVGPAETTGDSQAVLQILDNLVSNAIKYSPKETRVVVQVLQREDRFAIEVHDQGPGLSEADQKKLFQRFVRLSSKPTAGESSNGLGLSIVKRLAESMGGTVECRSELGRGSSFVLLMPGRKQPAAAASRNDRPKTVAPESMDLVAHRPASPTCAA